MRSLGVIVTIAAMVTCMTASPSSRANADPVVDLGFARFRGSIYPTLNISSWYGIRYAAPPTGNLRFAAPVDIESQNPYHRSEVYDATILGPPCYQQPTGWQSTAEANVSEDCLILNVHKPLEPSSCSLPVLVFIHGGGYCDGSAHDTAGVYMDAVSRGHVVYIEIQYRLGGFGFMNSKEVIRHGAANAGLLDQRASLGWIQRHIRAFGGDPDKITLIGGSAGGGSVTAQLQLYGGDHRPPFRAAIAEFPWWPTFHTPSIYEKQYNDVLMATSCKTIDCLRTLPFATIGSALNSTTIDAFQEGTFGYGDYYWGPGVDGKVIRELPHAAFRSGRFTKVPLVIDHDALEGWSFTQFDNVTNNDRQVQASLRQVWPNANATFFEKLDTLYPTSSFQDSYFSSPIVAAAAPSTTIGVALDERYPGLANAYTNKNPFPFKRAAVFGDAFISCGTRTVADAFVRYGIPVWKLIFNSGALVHSAIDYVLETPAAPHYPGHSNVTEGSILQAYYLSFAIALNPNLSPAFADVSRPHWAQYGSDSNVMYDNLTSFGQSADSDSSDRCQFLLEYADQLRN